jgi:hypothetical protein
MERRSTMREFMHKHAGMIKGVLSGFDRLVFRGSLLTLCHLAGMKLYLFRAGVLLKEFGAHAQGLSENLKAATIQLSEEMGRPIVYLPSSQTSKEDAAREMAKRLGITQGPIGILSSVEVCPSYEIRRDLQAKRLCLEPRLRKCLFYYHYAIDPVFGFMHARIQTWLPFSIQICINGREWLSRQMDEAGLSYLRRDNCFVWVEDAAGAQALLDKQVRVRWKGLLDGIAARLNPVHKRLFACFPMDYYWSVYQSEWATDLMFGKARDLAALYPRLLRHGIVSFASSDVMRFLGRKSPNEGQVHPAFKGEVVSDLKRRTEGVRIKHRVNGNSVKLYDKQGSVLRVETTIDQTREFLTFRRKQDQNDGKRTWQRMRKGVADLARRTQISQAANERYLDALASASGDTPLADLVNALCRPKKWKGGRVRAINPWNPHDDAMLETINRGEFNLNGFRNRDLRSLIYPDSAKSPDNERKYAAKITRAIRLLRAHGLIKKIPRTHRYQLSKKGRTAITAIIAAKHASVEQLTKAAA